MKISKIMLVGLLTLILLLSITIGHFLPPLGILAIPVVIPLMIGLIIFTDNGFNSLAKSVLSYLFIGLNDIGIKLFAGGIHDSEGTGWTHLMLFIGLIPSSIMLFRAVSRDKNASKWFKTISILLFILLIIIHLIIFETLGMVDPPGQVPHPAARQR